MKYCWNKEAQIPTFFYNLIDLTNCIAANCIAVLSVLNVGCFIYILFVCQIHELC